MMDAAALVTLSGVGKVFDTGTVALEGIDLAVRDGEFLTLLGPSGCGKSTILRLVAGLTMPSSGTVTWRDGAAPSVGFVFQEPTLMPWRTVFENVYLPLQLKHLGRDAARARIMAGLAEVGLETFAEAMPRELSGGMKMRASIARALVTQPSVLLMDEPFAALDEIARFRLNDAVRAQWAARGLTALFVTHSVFESVYLSTRIIVLSSRPGRIVADIAIDPEQPRDAAFRSSPEYGRYCGLVAEALQAAIRD